MKEKNPRLIIEQHFPWWKELPQELLLTSDRQAAAKGFFYEVNNFISYLEPTAPEILLRDYLIHKIKFTVRKLWSGAEVIVFGSFATNIYLPDSDIDLTIQLPPKVHNSSSRYIQLAKALNADGVSDGPPDTILSASVPVIKFQDRLTNLKVDITMNSYNGVEACRHIRQMLKKYPGLRELTLFVKYYLSQLELNEVFTGGLGGYATVCLVLSFLQRHPKVASGMINPKDNIGVLLLDFFDLYGNNFRLGDIAISVYRDGFYYQKRCRSRDGKPVFSIEDPLDSSNDIGCKSYKARVVTRRFRTAYNNITRKIFEINTSPSSDTRSSTFRDSSVLRPIGFIPLKMIQQRETILHVFHNKAWSDEEAAESFDWHRIINKN
ncbi:unnamed protein product [Cunninghamella blakesleeana]